MINLGGVAGAPCGAAGGAGCTAAGAFSPGDVSTLCDSGWGVAGVGVCGVSDWASKVTECNDCETSGISSAVSLTGVEKGDAAKMTRDKRRVAILTKMTSINLHQIEKKAI